MTDALALRDYQRLADLIEGQVGIRLPASKRAMVEGRLRRRVRALQLPDLEAYCRMLFDGGGLTSRRTAGCCSTAAGLPPRWCR